MENSRTHLYKDTFKLLLTVGIQLCPCITTTKVHFGQLETVFFCHVADYHCHSTNTVLDRAPKSGMLFQVLLGTSLLHKQKGCTSLIMGEYI